MKSISVITRPYKVNEELDVLVLSQQQAQTFTDKRPYVLISIRDPDAPVPELTEDPNRIDTLYLTFPDLENPGRGIELFSSQQAKDIIEFVDKHKSGVGLIVVHCKAGICRSPAVAAAIMKYMGTDDSEIHSTYYPNRWVYDTMIETMSPEI